MIFPIFNSIEIRPNIGLVEQARDDFEAIAGASSGAALPAYLAERMGSGYSMALQESVGSKLENALALATNSFAVLGL